MPIEDPLIRDCAPGRLSGLKARAVINVRAGTALGMTPTELCAAVSSAFADAGCAPEIACVLPEDLDSAIEAAARSDIDLLIVGGGDGTIRGAATRLMGTEKVLGILPLGTMNRLAKDLRIPLDLKGAAAALAQAQPAAIDVASVNGSVFLCNSIMGATLRYSMGRARLRGKPAHERLPRYLAIIRDILNSRRKLSIVVDHGESKLRIRAMSAAVANNGYDEDAAWLRRSDLSGGRLTLYVSKHRSGWGLARAMFRALAGRWTGDPEVIKLTGRSLIIHSRARRKWLANDGEVAVFRTPLHYEIHPGALKILVPQDPAS